MGLHHELLGEGTGLGCLCCLCMCKCRCWCCFLGSVCVCAYIACLMFVQVCLLGMHAQSCHWLDLGTCSSSSSSTFTPLGIPESANPNTYDMSKCRVSTLCANGNVKWTNKTADKIDKSILIVSTLGNN